MLIRIVRMTFREEATGDFLTLFTQTRDRIRHFPGCLHLELWQDYHQPAVYLTHSHWTSEEALQGFNSLTRLSSL